ncbi:N-terminal nucleophile aminohydrolase [Tothia fuscella]|uniref:N-terminal nucleophile aminohydrolase n=1 Tax=Tothia fuscella TaxID=1048955 RepID=A0A9P4NNY3_9PEZI|nr:N-terminal nucleophile aminohydrolase [Tothia fuscella]
MFQSKFRKGPHCAIVVHAGAGYHSIQNERVHLDACNDACIAAMKILQSGGDAVSAIEMAIKVLEDREITNAGYGSNLSMDGAVECDAVIVDHWGRSGGVGAISQVKNPISVAKVVLDRSKDILSLRRVPPNLLVAQGATDFAELQGIPIVPYDALVSPAARERWLRWRQDLRVAEKKTIQAGQAINGPSTLDSNFRDHLAEDIRHNRVREAHTEALIGKRRRASRLNTSNASSPASLHIYSAPATTQHTPGLYSPQSPSTNSEMSDPDMFIDPIGPPGSIHQSSASAFINSTQQIPALLTMSGTDTYETYAPAIGYPTTSDAEMWRSRRSHDGSEDGGRIEEESDVSVSSKSTLQLPSITPSPEPESRKVNAAEASMDTNMEEGVVGHDAGAPLPEPTPNNREQFKGPPSSPDYGTFIDGASSEVREPDDHITDTVGAIAIDQYGHMACGASSGGIGMKYRGRAGPAALVGVGAAIVPVHPEDKGQKTVGTVTSGTGEHMGTTLAASTCAERLYHEVQSGRGGQLETVDDDDVLEAFIERDFMGHPSVKESKSAGAIGLVSVKKTKEGVILYFAHNTDSFALASMSSEDLKPHSTMSRSQANGKVAHGARSLGGRPSKKTRISKT